MEKREEKINVSKSRQIGSKDNDNEEQEKEDVFGWESDSRVMEGMPVIKGQMVLIFCGAIKSGPI